MVLIYLNLFPSDLDMTSISLIYISASSPAHSFDRVTISANNNRNAFE